MNEPDPCTAHIDSLIAERDALQSLIDNAIQLANQWDAEGDRYSIYVENSSIPAVHRTVSQVLASNAEQLRSVLDPTGEHR